MIHCLMLCYIHTTAGETDRVLVPVQTCHRRAMMLARAASMKEDLCIYRERIWHLLWEFVVAFILGKVFLNSCIRPDELYGKDCSSTKPRPRTNVYRRIDRCCDNQQIITIEMT
jgi:hypothetical protein